MKYVYNGKIKELPRAWRFSNGKTTGNFHQLPEITHINEGWLPITIINNEDYDPEIQTRTGPTVVKFQDHAELNYVVTDKSLTTVKKAKQAAIVQEAVALLLSKWNLHARQFGFNTTPEDIAMDADQATLVNYFKNTIKGKLDAANTLQKLKNITYTWPII